MLTNINRKLLISFLQILFMGSKAIQGELWGQRSKDWASIQEQTGNTGYWYALYYINLTSNDKVLDVGCGSGLFCSLAITTGAQLTGIDASERLIEEAKRRTEAVTFLTGEMEELPFAADSFDVVCGFNSFQYAENVINAFGEAKRVLKPKGKLVVMIWGNKEECEATTYLEAIESLLPPSPSNALGPFALSENELLEKKLKDAGFKIIDNADVDSVWDYASTDIALKGLLSAGQAAKAIVHSGYAKVYETVSEAIQPYVQNTGRVVFKNMFRMVICENA